MPAPGIATSNPFAILNSKKAQSKEKEDKKPAKAPAAPAKNAAEPKKKEPKPAPGKVISLADVQKIEEEKKAAAKEQKKEEKLEHKVEKVQKAQTDRQDRSNKRSHVRKEGNGVGGWDATPTAAVEEESAAIEKVEPKSPVVTEEARVAAEEEAKAQELEEKQMTYDEYLATKESVDQKFNIRTVDAASFANMKRSTKQGGEVLKIGAKAAAPKKVEAVAASKDKVQDKVTLKKEGMALSGFRMENPARRTEREGGQTRGRGGAGRGGGKGMGRARNAQQSEGDNATSQAPQIDNEELFPSLRSAPTPAAAE